MDWAVRVVLKLGGWCMAALIAAMVAVTFVQVGQRYLFGSSLFWAEEFARYCFVWIVFLGSALAFDHGMHIGVDLITQSLNVGVRRALALVAELLVAVFCAVVVYASVPVLQVNAMQVSPALEMPMSYVYAAIPTSMTLIAVLSLVRAIRIVMGDENAIKGQHGVEL